MELLEKNVKTLAFATFIEAGFHQVSENAVQYKVTELPVPEAVRECISWKNPKFRNFNFELGDVMQITWTGIVGEYTSSRYVEC